MQKTVVLNVVGLTGDLIARGAPSIARWARDAVSVPVESAFPAVTCTAQSDYLTGAWPDAHGIVGNGWYVREDCEVRFWRQSNRLVLGAEDLGHRARRGSVLHLREPVLVVQHVLLG